MKKARRAALTVVAAAALARAVVACGGDASGSHPGSAADAATDARAAATDASLRGAPGDGAVDADDGAGRSADGSPPISDAGDGGAATDADSALCPTGSTLVSTRTACAPPAAIDPAVVSALAAIEPGDSASIGATSGFPCLPVLVCTPAAAPPLVFSDSPESPAADGILYADTFPAGDVRMYVYHTNGGALARKFSLVALNTGTADAHVTVTRRGLAGPSTAYVDVGVSAVSRFLADARSDVVIVPAGQRVVVDSALDALSVATNELVNLVDDLALDAQLKLSVVTVAAGADAASMAGSLPLAAPDASHQRGTFPAAERTLVATVPLPADGMARLSLGSGATEDILVGRDAVDGTAPTLLGNYGLLYRFVFTAAAAESLAFAPRGGDWGGAGQLVTSDGGSPSAFSLGAPTAIPADGHAGLAARVGPSLGAPAVLSFFSAGGSSLPVDLLVVPAD